MYLSRVLPVPVGDEVVELSLDDLPGDIEDYVQVLREERCSAPFWLKLASECGARRRFHDCEIVLHSAITTLTNTPPPRSSTNYRAPQAIAEEIAPFHAMLATLQLGKARSLPKIVLKDAKYQNLISNDASIEGKDRWFQAAAMHNNAIIFPPPPTKVAPGSRQDSVGLRTNMLLGRGIYLTASGKTEDALKAFDTVLQRQVRNPVALLGKACCLLRKRSYVAALRLYQSVLAISIAQTSSAAKESAIVGPDGELVESQASKWLGPDPRVGIGLCLYGLGRVTEAQRAWKRAIAVNAKNPASHLLLGLSKMNLAKQLTPLDAAIVEERGEAQGTTEAAARADLYKEGIAHIQVSWKLDNKNAMAAVALAEHFCVRASVASTTNKAQAQQEYERALKLAEHAVQYADSRVAVNQAWLTFARAAHLYSYLDETSTSTVELRAIAQRFYSRVADDLGRNSAASDPSTLAPGQAMAVLGLAQLQASRGEILGAINTTEAIMAKSASVSSSCLEISLFTASLRAQSHPGATAAERIAGRERARIILDRTLRTIEACEKLALGNREEDESLDEGLRAVLQLTNPEESNATASEAAELALARTALAKENLSLEAARDIAKLAGDELNYVEMADILRDPTSGVPEFTRAASALLFALRSLRRKGQDIGEEGLSSSPDVSDKESLALRLRSNLSAMLALRGMDNPTLEQTALSLAVNQMQESLSLAAKAVSSTGLDAEKTIVLYNLGRTLELMGNAEDAQKAYSAVLAAHPEYVDAKVRSALLTVCNPDMKGNREATHLGNTLLKEALASNPSNIDTRSAYVCFLSGDLPASPNPPQWDGIKETIAQLFMGPSSSQAVQIFGSATAARTITDEARRDAFTLATLGWAYYNLGHNQTGPNSKKEKLRALLRCCDLLDKALTEDSRCAFALQGLAILSAEGTLVELTSAPNVNLSAQDLEGKRKRGAEDAISMLTKLREVTEDSSVHICTGHAYMVREDFERAFRSYELAARKTAIVTTNGDANADSQQSSAANATTKPSLLQYLARASYHLGMQTKSYPVLKQSIEFFEQALVQLQQRASSGAITEAKYVQYNIAVSRQKILQMLFDLPQQSRQLSVLQEAVEGIQSSQDTFKALLPDAQAGKLAGITAEIVEQRLLYSETSLQRAAQKNVEEQQAYEERVKAEREAIVERKRERQEQLNRELMEREEERKRRAEAIEEERKRAIEETRAWEYVVEEEKAPRKSAAGHGGGKSRPRKTRRRKMDEGGSEIESEDDDGGNAPLSDSDDGMIVDDESDIEQGDLSDGEEVLGKPVDSGDDDDLNGDASNPDRASRRADRKKLRLKRASGENGKKSRSSRKSQGSSSKGEKRSRKSRSRVVGSDDEDGDANGGDDDEDDDRPSKKPKKGRMRRAKDEDLIESEEEV